MSTNLKRRLEALESRLGGGDEVVEFLGVRLTRARLREVLEAASGTSIGVATGAPPAPVGEGTRIRVGAAPQDRWVWATPAGLPTATCSPGAIAASASTKSSE